MLLVLSAILESALDRLDQAVGRESGAAHGIQFHGLRLSKGLAVEFVQQTGIQHGLEKARGLPVGQRLDTGDPPVHDVDLHWRGTVEAPDIVGALGRVDFQRVRGSLHGLAALGGGRQDNRIQIDIERRSDPHAGDQADVIALVFHGTG